MDFTDCYFCRVRYKNCRQAVSGFGPAGFMHGFIGCIAEGNNAGWCDECRHRPVVWPVSRGLLGYFRRFVVAEMTFTCGSAARAFAQHVNLAFGGRHRYQLFQLCAAAVRAGQYGSWSDQQLKFFVTLSTAIIVDRHTSSCRFAYKIVAVMGSSKIGAWRILALVSCCSK